MPSDESIVLDPSQFAAGRTALAFDELGLAIRTAEWGDAEQELFLIKQLRGEIPSDRHPPNRKVTLQIRVREEGSVSLAEAAFRLQAKVGVIQDEPGSWVERIPDSSLGAEAPVAFPCYGAVLGGLHGWLMAHRQVAEDVSLVLTVGPYPYGVEPVEIEAFTEEEKRYLIWEVENVKGSAPGLIRRQVTNKNASAPWRAVIAAMESRDHPQNETSTTTADLVYEAEDLTPLGKAAIATRSGASGGGASNVVKLASVPNQWYAMLGSEIDEVGHMTHKGPRRIWLRVYEPGAGLTEPGDVEFRLEWRVLGSPRWLKNDIVPLPVANNFSLIDLGEVRPQPALLGDDRWECRVTVRKKSTAVSPPTTRTIELDVMVVAPTENYLKVSEPVVNLDAPSALASADNFNQVVTGGADPATGLLEELGAAYVALEGSDATDFEVEDAGHTLRRTAVSDTGATIGGQKGRAIGPKELNLKGTVATLSFETSLIHESTFQGLVIRSNHTKNNGIHALVLYSLGVPYVRLSKAVAGVGAIHGTFRWPFTQNGIAKGTLALWAEGETVAVLAKPPGATTYQVIGVARHADFAGSLKEGGVYILDSQQAATAVTRTYHEFSAWEPDPDSICFAGRGIELRSDGAIRQDATDDVWGKLSIQGFYPVSPPSRLESRTLRGLLIPSQGDLAALPDAGDNKMSESLHYFPGYHFMSEAE